MQTIDFISIITIAFFGSFGHCIGMCGAIVVAYTSKKINSSFSKTQQSLSHLFYSLGRITTYVSIGAVFGYFGQVVTIGKVANATLLAISGILMILVGISLLGKLKFLTIIEHSLLNSSLYQKYFKKFIDSNSMSGFYTLGLLNGFLPCGLVYFFAITAISTQSIFYGALVMLIFGLSTIPALFSLGFFVSLFNQGKFRQIMIKIASILVIVYGLVVLYKAYNYII